MTSIHTRPQDLTLLKFLSDEVADILTMIFQASLDQGKIPQDWKKAFISPIFKKGDRHKPSNYRPVSLTSICYKILETLCTATWSNILMIIICSMMHSMASVNVFLVNHSWSWQCKTLQRDSMMGSRSTLCCLTLARRLTKFRTNDCWRSYVIMDWETV